MGIRTTLRNNRANIFLALIVAAILGALCWGGYAIYTRSHLAKTATRTETVDSVSTTNLIPPTTPTVAVTPTVTETNDTSVASTDNNDDNDCDCDDGDENDDDGDYSWYQVKGNPAIVIDTCNCN